MITRKTALYLICMMTAGVTARASADDSAAQDGLTIGVGAETAPRYSGSDQQTWQLVPLIQARKGAFFFDTQKGLGYDLQSDNGLYLEHTLGYSLGRSDRDSDWRDGSDKLQGMGNINATVNTALALGWAVTPWLSLEAKATLPLSDSQGVNYQTSLTLIPLQNSSDTVALQSAALFGDARYMNTFYGVSRLQSARSGFSRYNAQDGFYGVESSLSWSHQFNPHWGTVVSAGYTWLGDHAADSPLVDKRDQATGTLAVTYTF